ncbi:MAG TPA: EAL domain-containing protein [Actinotalea sp.]|nr:EAL domain-containing protein [Actinotalea sp.]
MSRGRGVTGAPRGLDRALLLGASASPWVTVVVLAALLAVSWLVVWFTGGTQRAYPHLFYVPIILAGVPFGMRGTVTTAVVAAVLVGPLMPLDAVTGEPQPMRTWITRAVFFVVIGALGSASLTARERSYQRQLAVDVRWALHREVNGTPVDAELVALVETVLVEAAFHPVYQPLYSLTTGRLLGVEALTRFDVDPHRPPDAWFAAATHAGLGVDLEIAAIAAALRHAQSLPADVELSVNASPATLDDPRLAEMARAAGGRQIVVEITEHAVVEDYEGLLDKVGALRALGVKIAVDDAGAGISSLRHIVQLAPDIIKLDISLTQDLSASPLRRALAGSLIEFADQTGAQLLVEGIEEIDDLVAWTHLGAHAAQGFLLGRPSALPVPLVSGLIALHPANRFLAGGRTAV